uniref:Uncharacterized protein n=1 Tax=Glossina pallidipes TaxID=7398 RepID=A0A1A9ZA31_GLOPL
MKIDDKVHGKIVMPKDIGSLIENRFFGRLKGIRQLGLTEPAVKTTQVIERNRNWIKDNQIDGKISPLYRNAVLLAALVYDIVHEPFSHTWEVVHPYFDYEAISEKLIDKIFVECPQIFVHLRENNNRGIDLIKSLITGRRKDFKRSLPNEYRFIFEIVSNKFCQIDVDKWDYLKGDGHVFGKASLIDFDQVLLNSRAGEDGPHVEYLNS